MSINIFTKYLGRINFKRNIRIRPWRYLKYPEISISTFQPKLRPTYFIIILTSHYYLVNIMLLPGVISSNCDVFSMYISIFQNPPFHARITCYFNGSFVRKYQITYDSNLELFDLKSIIGDSSK